MDRKLTLLSVHLALCLSGLTVQPGVADNWASIQQRFDVPAPPDDSSSEEEETSLKRRFWNDDLEPCIMKYCLRRPMETRMYMKCLRRHCPSGLVTVPRDLETEVDEMLNLEDSQSKVALGRIWQGMNAEYSDGEKKVNCVCAKVYCGYIKQREMRAQCERSACSSDALKVTGGNTNALKDHSASFWRWLAGLARSGSSSLALVETGIRQRCDTDTTSGTKSHPASRIDKALTASDANEMDRSVERTLKRKRRINDDVSQCIQSYCGDHGSQSRLTRIACIIKSCHRTG